MKNQINFTEMVVRLFITIIVVLTFIVSCEDEILVPNDNIPPTTTLANIPIELDTIFALGRMQWDGGDMDGYIKGYEWTYTTTYSSSGEVVNHDWVFTEATDVTVAFDSRDTVGNFQYFKVRSIDNMDTPDPNPATRSFYTEQTIPPVLQILSPAQNSEFLAIEEVTDWFEGIPLLYTGEDEDGEITSYGISIDGGDVFWVEDTSLFITPDQFGSPFEGDHTITLKAKDNTNIESKVIYSVDIRLIVPSFEKEILIIDETIESDFPGGTGATDALVDSFYMAIFGVTDSVDNWDYEHQALISDTLPSLDMLGQYKMVVWHADNRPTSDPHMISAHEDYLRNYMNVGGDFVMSGWRILKSFAWSESFPVVFEEDSFVAEYLHILEADETGSRTGDCIGGYGAFSGFSDFDVDATRLPSGAPYRGKLTQINTIRSSAGFTDVLYRYKADVSSTLSWAGQPIGLLYTGTAFNAVILGFPLYFLEHDDATIMVDEMLSTMGYR